jgi:hypothetical protein
MNQSSTSHWAEGQHSSPTPLPCRLPGWRNGARRRRGVLLLLMLCLLVLFAALGVTYVLVSSQYRRSSVVQHRVDQYAVDYRSQLDEAAMQVFRGTHNHTRSVLRIHSLLEDMYGNDSISSGTTNITVMSAKSAVKNDTSTQPQLVDLALNNPNVPVGTAPPSGLLPWPMGHYYTNPGATPVPAKAPPIVGAAPYFDKTNANSVKDTSPNLKTNLNPTIAPCGYFNGCVLTFTSGPAAGQSTRIVGYDNGMAHNSTPDASGNLTPTLRVMSFPAATTLINQGSTPPLGAQFVINGRPFNGTGFGFNPTANPTGVNSFGLVNANDNPTSMTATNSGPTMRRLYALMPNPLYLNIVNNPSYNTAGGIGGADEDYDAADWNNMLLGLTRSPSTNIGQNDFLNAAPQQPPYPSLHRPELINYWLHAIGGMTPLDWPTLVQNDPDLARQISLRPIGALNAPPSANGPDHPNFTGSNPNPTGFDPIKGPWDVDNDGDGVMDSIWVDIGLPVQTAPDGTTYRPLAAISVLDMDGRLNVNAHGNSAQTESTYDQPITGSATILMNLAGAALPGTLTPSPPASAYPGTPPPYPSPVVPQPTAANTSPGNTLIAGSGYGTADVNLLPIYTQGGTNDAAYTHYGFSGSLTQTQLLQELQYFQQQYQYLMSGAAAGTLASQSGGGTTPAFEGRYGESQGTTSLPNSAATASTYTAATLPSGNTPPYPGYTPNNDNELMASMLGLIKHWDFPIPAYPGQPTAYGTAPDLWGRAIAALDIAGNPIMPIMSSQPFPTATYYGLGGQYDTLNNPYLLNLSRGTTVRGAKPLGATDNPFTPAELEWLLRNHDIDSNSLPTRLASLLTKTSLTSPPAAGTVLGTLVANLRQQVTTDSFDLPSPAILAPTTATGPTLPPNQRTHAPLAGSIADLLEARLSLPATPTDPMLKSGAAHAGWNELNIQLQLMLPPDLMSGQRFDINRSFGNGRDDDADGVVDEPDEYYLGEPAWLIASSANSPPVTAGVSSGTSPFPSLQAAANNNNAVNLAIDWNGDGNINAADALMARQQMARYLYVLACLFVEPTVFVSPSGIIYDLNRANTHQTQFALAQWAINCVDFRDRDSIMTPFEFDINPFNGWGVDGVVGTADDTSTERALVWGCERPELLITETLAWHDRRTEDLATPSGKTTDPLPNNDATGGATNDFDQRLIPYPACFIELYNPWATPYSMRNSTTASVPSPTEVSAEFYYDPTSSANGNALTPYGSTSNTYPTYPTPQAPGGVLLNKMAVDPAGSLPSSPVWRMIFVKNHSGSTPDPRTLDPDDPFANSPQGAAARTSYAIQPQDIDRVVFFSPSPAGATYPTMYATASGFTRTAPAVPSLAYYSSLPVSPIKPGRYAVVGSANQIVGAGIAGVTATSPATGNVFMSKVGRATGATDSAPPTAGSSIPRVVLAPDSLANPDHNQVWVCASGQTTPTDPSPLNGTGTAQDTQPAVGIVVDTFLPASGTIGPNSTASAPTNIPTIRFFSISDPPTSTGYLGKTTGATAVGSEDEYALATTADSPFDSLAGGLGADGTMMLNQTQAGYRTVHLQRLADPTMPYNPPATDPNSGALHNANYPVNIYLTVDSAPIDVTSFNGVPMVAPTTTDPKALGTTQGFQFCSTQRGDQGVVGGLQSNLLWAHEPTHLSPASPNVPMPAAAPDGPGANVFNWIMRHSLAYVSRPYGTPIPTSTATAGANGLTQTYAGSLLPTAGQPIFPWLNWNNRPFVSAMELTLVPKSRSGRLLADYSTTATTPGSLYQMGSAPPNASNAYAGVNGPGWFGYLLDFFDAGQFAATLPYKNLYGLPAPNLYRMLEYVQVPSKFVGTETILGPSSLSPKGFSNGTLPLHPATASSQVNTGTQTILTGDAEPGIPKAWNGSTDITQTWNGGVIPYGQGSTPFGTLALPPFNRVSEYRDPGRVNINTVVDPPVTGVTASATTVASYPGSVVWQGILNGASSPQWASSSTSVPTVTGTLLYNPTSSQAIPQYPPSYFTNPFRSAAGAALTNSIYADPTVNVFSIGGVPAPLRDIDATLLRPIMNTAGGNTFADQTLALFDAPSMMAAATGGGAVQAYNDPTRNPYFRIQNASRMTNLLTTRSNVYAVWITIGYFQVTPWYGYGPPPPTSGPVIYDTAHTDGYQLGQELGSDTGEIRRHRAFYLFDRTIPVGFQRGVDHNVQNAILLRRFIE